MNRVIVAGGTGFFGSRIVRELKKRSIEPLVASRSTESDLRLNVQRPGSIEDTLEAGDLVVDAVGPFQERSSALIEGAIDIGFHLIDLADSISYVRNIYSRESEIRESGIQVRTSCSAVSTLPGLFLNTLPGEDPVRVRGFLAPATAYANYPGTVRAIFQNIGRPVEMFEDGHRIETGGWSRSASFPFPEPVGDETGYLYESPDAFLLPRDHSTLASVTFYSCPRSGVMDTMMHALKYTPTRWLANKGLHLMLPLVRWFGEKSGGVGYEVHTLKGNTYRFAVVAEKNGLLVPVLPSVLAVQKCLESSRNPSGLVPPSQHVSPDALFDAFARNDIQVYRNTGDEAYERFHSSHTELPDF